MKAVTAAILMSVLALGATVSPPAHAGDRLLGSTHLTKVENDKDVLVFAKCRRGIRAVQVRAHQGQIEIERLWVRYANGARDDLDVRDRIGQGGHSRWIDLRGDGRCIKAIGIVGDTELSYDQARVDIWGR